MLPEHSHAGVEPRARRRLAVVEELKVKRLPNFLGKIHGAHEAGWGGAADAKPERLRSGEPKEGARCPESEAREALSHCRLHVHVCDTIIAVIGLKH